MKNILKLSTILSFAFLMAFTSAVQAQKIAYVESQDIIVNMPAYRVAKSEVEAYGKQLQKMLEGKQAEMQTYYTEVMEKAQKGLLTPIQQKEAEAKLQQMQQDLQKQTMEAEQKLMEKEQSKLKPLYEQFDSAVKAVASENGYAYIIDKQYLMYSEGGINATTKIKAKLGM